MFLVLFLCGSSLIFAVDPNNPPASIRVTVDKGGETRTFNLDKYSIRGPNFELVLLDPNGVGQTTIDPGPVRTYRGWCEEEPDSYVEATLLPNGDIRYMVFKGHDYLDWTYEPALVFDENAGPDNNFTEIGGTPVNPNGTAYTNATFIDPDENADLGDFYKTVYQADIGFDLLVEYTDTFDYSDDWAVYGRKAENAISHYNAIYIRDGLMETQLGKVVIRQSQNGLSYENPQWGVEWPAINTYWNALFPDVDHHFVGMIGNVGGGVSFVCDIGGQDWAARSLNGWSTGGNFWHVARHEMGHNNGAGDNVGTEGCTVMTGNCITLNRFSRYEIEQWMWCRASAYAYMRELGAYSYPVPPYAKKDYGGAIRVDNTVYIDVLGNDYDANVDQIAISSFDTETTLGGTVEFSVGSGPDGRDELVYIAPPYAGDDTFQYSIVDDTGRVGYGSVAVYVDAPRLTGYWPLDEGAGSTSEDLTANNNDLTINNTENVSWDSGRFDNALVFDGSVSGEAAAGVELFGTSIYETGSVSVNIDIPVANGTYQLQLLLYEGWPAVGSRTMDLTIEGVRIYDDLSVWTEQGAASENGIVVNYNVTVTDGNIDITVDDSTNNIHIAGLVLNSTTDVEGIDVVGQMSDLDLNTGDVIKAINFGNTSNQTVGGVTFLAADYNTTVDGVTNDAGYSVHKAQYDQSEPYFGSTVKTQIDHDPGSFSVSAWLKPSVLGVDQRAIAKGNSANGWQIELTPSNTAQITVMEDTGVQRTAGGTTVFDTSTWHHVVGVFDVANQQLKLYVDKTEQASTAMTATTGSLANSSPFMVGRSDEGGLYPFNGSIDDIRYYSFALSPDEIADVFEGGVVASNPDPYDFEEDMSTNAVLSWVPSTTATDHDVYFGTDPNAVRDATATSDEYMDSQPGVTYDPNLDKATTYYWRIDEVDGGGVHTGDVWQFTTSPNWMVDQAADLDLTNVVKAINFGSATNKTVSGVTFLAAYAGTTVGGVYNDAAANIGSGSGIPTLSGADAAALQEIYGSNVWNPEVVNISTDLADGYYKVQVLLYEQWVGSREVTVTAETAVADPLLMGTSTHPAGLVLELNTPVTDGTLNIVVSEVSAATNMHVAGLIVNIAASPGDFEPDGDVDLMDLLYLTQRWLSTGCAAPDWCGGADLDHLGGIVNLLDFAIFAENWLK